MNETPETFAHLNVTTPRNPETLHNFGPVSSRDSIVFTSERPGGEPKGGEESLIPNEVVKGWIDFMRNQGIKHVLILLDDNELEVYDYPGLLKMYTESGFLQYHRVPMGEEGASKRAMEILKAAEKANEKVVAHCTHGMGRSGRVAAGWLAYRYDLPCHKATEEALDVARQLGMERLGNVEMLDKWLGSLKPE